MSENVDVLPNLTPMGVNSGGLKYEDKRYVYWIFTPFYKTIVYFYSDEKAKDRLSYIFIIFLIDISISALDISLYSI